MSYNIEFEFPIRFLDDDIWEILVSYNFEDHDVDQVTSVQNEHIAYLYIEDEGSGRLEKLEQLLRKKQVPYDRHCSDGEGNAPDNGFYRPGMKDEKVISLTMDGYEFIDKSMIVQALEEPDDKLRSFIHNLLDDYTSHNIPKLVNYIHETELGSDTKKMSAIDEVLARLDRGEINNSRAIELIAEIRKGDEKDGNIREEDISSHSECE